MFIFKFLDKVHDSRQAWLLQTDRVPKTAVALEVKPKNQTVKK
jgi:hypothetical protein